MTMAMASHDEWKRAIDFVNALEEEIKFPEMSDEELRKFIESAPCLFRIVFGYRVLVDNVCDPSSDTLAYNAELTVAIQEHQARKRRALVPYDAAFARMQQEVAA